MAEQEPPIKKPKIIDPGLGHFPPIEETKVAVGSIISYGGTNYEINELPNAGNGQEYVLRPPGQPTAVPYTLPMALLTKVLANGEAKLLTPEIKTGAEEEKAKALRADFNAHVARARRAFEEAKAKILNTEDENEARQALEGNVQLTMGNSNMGGFLKTYASIPEAQAEAEKLADMHHELLDWFDYKFHGSYRPGEPVVEEVSVSPVVPSPAPQTRAEPQKSDAEKPAAKQEVADPVPVETQEGGEQVTEQYMGQLVEIEKGIEATNNNREIAVLEEKNTSINQNILEAFQKKRITDAQYNSLGEKSIEVNKKLTERIEYYKWSFSLSTLRQIIIFAPDSKPELDRLEIRLNGLQDQIQKNIYFQHDLINPITEHDKQLAWEVQGIRDLINKRRRESAAGTDSEVVNNDSKETVEVAPATVVDENLERRRRHAWARDILAQRIMLQKDIINALEVNDSPLVEELYDKYSRIIRNEQEQELNDFLVQGSLPDDIKTLLEQYDAGSTSISQKIREFRERERGTREAMSRTSRVPPMSPEPPTYYDERERDSPRLEIEAFPASFIEDEIYFLLNSKEAKKKIKKVINRPIIEGRDGRMILTTKLLVKTTPVTPSAEVNLRAIFEEREGAIAVIGLEVQAMFEKVKRDVEKAIAPYLDHVSEILKERLERDSDKKVEGMRIMDGELVVDFITQDAPREEVFPPIPAQDDRERERREREAALRTEIGERIDTVRVPRREPEDYQYQRREEPRMWEEETEIVRPRPIEPTRRIERQTRGERHYNEEPPLIPYFMEGLKAIRKADKDIKPKEFWMGIAKLPLAMVKSIISLPSLPERLGNAWEERKERKREEKRKRKAEKERKKREKESKPKREWF
ncbi:MAG: hypothetical protein UU82_C0008G0004 [Candidatus Nomurabacteria bacterium GW2011_GWC2_41_8]|uniref:Uncharacterized protein n=3 Tax=Candidatus Nomuraibacteriota TaxID=1752729 RepID=A0A1F6YDC4_9BACT|nr:MAG: hypothetical protein US18_C0044G0002 [Parcubacteria group bacterium GW2011_GWB1_36_5]KKS04561.1 MAG: hypothetical protein UU58_C0005G0010 [Candidatus Nomurabacteria bacterium GW2011_GWA2_41_25]KKS24283.1 MAG: hypothetical protein UU82_C0008G0004 [Candidatus Nomurabacteria bacterium GW2011_GWC2_41_8]OGI66862.1 MAG: hypothetical protein A2823_03125 [Candidatus Nomurabacteria bacterium RIFCSPHIGHO2_01_FULL_41_91]OGI80580.1 MAG: hypothetical protein A3D43_02065 [Candidatus Nomurabacteria ba